MDTIFRARNQRTTWQVDPDGLLRFKGSVLKSGLLQYTLKELEGEEGLPPDVEKKGFAVLYVPPDELARQESLRSLEGRPVNLDHAWGEAGKIDAVGAVAGMPYYCDNNKLLYADALINDPSTIRRITSIDNDGDKLVEISAAYRTKTDWSPGVTPDGEFYDGVQRDIKYNHITLLPRGEGRAGEEVRIINRKKGVSEMEFTTMKVGNSKIRVHNEDADRLQDEIDTRDTKIANAVDGSTLEESISQVDELNKTIAEMKSERDDMAGELNAVKEQLEEVTSPEAMGDMVAEAVSEQEDADMILDAFNADSSEEEDDDSDDKKENSGAHSRKLNSKKVFGHALRLKVVNSVRKIRNQALLDDEMSKNEDMIRGMFRGLRDSVSVVKAAKGVVNGAEVMKAMNKKSVELQDKELTKAKTNTKVYNSRDDYLKDQYSYRYNKHSQKPASRVQSNTKGE